MHSRIVNGLLLLSLALTGLSASACSEVFDTKPPQPAEATKSTLPEQVTIDSGRGTVKSDKHQLEVSIGGPHPVGTAENKNYKLELGTPVGD